MVKLVHIIENGFHKGGLWFRFTIQYSTEHTRTHTLAASVSVALIYVYRYKPLDLRKFKSKIQIKLYQQNWKIAEVERPQ